MVAVYPVAAKAAEFTSVTLAGGVTVEFAVVLPDGFTADKAWPAILAFPPGGQNKAMVNTGLGWWESEAQRRGYLVFSPAAPSSELFFDGSRGLIRPFAEALLSRYPVQGGQFHLGGISNGGISAFTAALDHPDLLLSIAVLPGFPRGEDLAAIQHMKINMFAGETDTAWVAQMVRTNDALTAIGADVFMEVVPNAGHTLPSLAGPGASRLFDLLP